ncbi:pyruvate/2-oxoglutarate dehydrogenase complex dihydrolipoamide acyltransferase (E2) component [Duganella sp. 1411]|uniref:DUF4124 domain-containing protein n=1 Tax=Duganella sp. 1411 TaxID=2806572 RepID=UPI001B5BA00A|nr:DUF4124 domain-containing protein [Duganella sp. 1411]MBP1203034.1 pyruvate/2-oxoglutarate dehydrogenase complex dihydrolipoamide acyltransferase (E2) component [Duganella sp. 1411]
MDHLHSTRRARFPLAPLAKSSALFLVLLALGLPRAALAQYIWIDDKGIKQLSDRPPPPSVPAKRILKAPGKTAFNPNASPAEADTGGPAADGAERAAAAVPKAPPTVAEREAAFNQRRAERAAAERKAAEDAQQKADVAANCDAARQNQRALDQGMRLANIDKNGERAIMSDQERAELAKKNQKVLAGCQ